MSTIERSIEVSAPASKAYAVWTRFELFPHFMEDVQEVRQLDDRHLSWRARFWGKTEAWDAEITEQLPDKRIAWRSQAGAKNAGVVTFHRLSDDRCKVMLQVEFEPSGLAERIGDALGLASARAERDLAGFRRFVESIPDDPDGWTGRIESLPDAGQQGRSR